MVVETDMVWASSAVVALRVMQVPCNDSPFTLVSMLWIKRSECGLTVSA